MNTTQQTLFTLDFKKRIIKIALSVLALIFAIMLVSWIVKLKESDEKYAEFKSETKQFDILVYGSSHVMNGFSPMLLWAKYGMTSYNFGNPNSTIPQTYWVIRNSIKYNKPDIIVLDIAFIKRDEKTEGVTWGHTAFDAFPLSLEKVAAVNDLYTDINDKVDILFPFSRYHARWSDSEVYTAENIYDLDYNIEKGAYTQFNVTSPEDYFEIDMAEMNLTETTGKLYLRKIIELCSEKDIKIVLVNIPAFDNEEIQEYNNSVQVIADEYGVPYLNLPYLNVVDKDKDCADGSDHLNFYGECKVTDYIGNYLATTYNITDKRSMEDYADWNEDYNRYIDYINGVDPECAEFADTYLKTE